MAGRPLLFLIAALPALAGPVGATPAAPVAGDKALHGLAGSSAAFLGAAAAYVLLDDREPGAAAGGAAAVGFGTAALIGLAKELLDLAGAGDPDPLDYLCTLLGGAAAAAAAYGLLRAPTGAESPTSASIPLVSFGIVLALPVAGAWFRARGAGPPERSGSAADER